MNVTGTIPCLYHIKLLLCYRVLAYILTIYCEKKQCSKFELLLLLLLLLPPLLLLLLLLLLLFLAVLPVSQTSEMSTVSVISDSYNTPIFINGPDKSGFNHGTFANFVDVFGEQKLLWFLPVRSGYVSDAFDILLVLCVLVKMLNIFLCRVVLV